MIKKILSSLFLAIVLLSTGIQSYAQEGAYTGYTPYSIFGVGDLSQQGSSYNRAMGGVGIATRNKKYINYLNPAAVTARDSLSFMADMSLQQTNKIISQGDLKTVNNTFNINDIAISFPLYKSSAMLLGISPYSSTGYGYSSRLDDPNIVGNTGEAVYYSGGSGDIYQLFADAGVTFWKRLSLGVEGKFLFGSLDKQNIFKFANPGYSNISSGYSIMLRGGTAKLGVQYEQPVGDRLTIGAGATYSFKSNLRGYIEDYKYAAGTSQSDTLKFVRDTLANSPGRVNIPSEFGIGLSLNSADRWRAEVNYTRSDWTKSGMDKVPGMAVEGASVFSTSVAESYRAGFEIVPNINDIRYYYRRVAYRAGLYYEKAYYALDGNQIRNYGLTVGASLPVFRYYNAVNLSMDLGQRASLSGNMIRERYVNFTIGFNFFDIWFRKPVYE